MLRDVVLHLLNEQPVLADLLFEPAQTDYVLICRNLRTINGKKPVFVDRTDSSFIIPMAHIRFVEIHRTSIEASTAEKATRAAAAASDRGSDRRLLDESAWLDDGTAAGPGSAGADAGTPGEDGGPQELDDDLMRRIHDA